MDRVRDTDTSLPARVWPITATALGLGVLFWVGDALVDAFVFNRSGLLQAVAAPSPYDLLLRSTVLCLFLLFGFYAQHVLITRRRAETALRERTRFFALEAEVGRVLNRPDAFQVQLQGCAEALTRHVHAALARIWTLNPAERVLELRASAGLYTHLDGRHSRVAVGQYKIGRIAADRKPHLTNAVIGDPQVHDQDWAKREGLVAFAGYPLLRGAEVVGVMALFARHPLSEFTLDMLALVADRIAVAVQRQAAADALRRLSKQHELILESAGEGIYGLDREGRTTFVNPAAAAMLGYAPEELLGAPMHGTVHHSRPDGSRYPAEDCLIHAAFRDGAPRQAEWDCLWRRDGTAFPVEYTSTPIWEDHHLAGAVVTFRDITERRRAQEALKRSEHLLSSVINNTTAVIYVKWLDGRYLMINSRYEQLFDVTQEQMRGKTDHDLFPRAIADAFRANDLKVLQTAGPVELEEYAPQEDGLHAYISVKFPLLDEQGKPYAICGISTDITELKRAQEDLRKSEAERMAALQQSDALKTALLSSVSHELRTPLAAIKSSVAALMQRDRAKSHAVNRELLQAINYEVDALTSLVDNLLCMSRIEARLLKPQCEEHLMEELLEAALRQFAAELADRKVEVSIPPDLPTVSVDAVLIRNVLANLLDNAVKYSDEQSPITIRVERGGQAVHVHVVSIGEPVPQDDVAKIFERFYRVASQRRHPIRGTGLGLAICQGFVEAHGGRIWAESSGGKATTITFTLPCANAVSGGAAARSEPANPVPTGHE